MDFIIKKLSPLKLPESAASVFERHIIKADRELPGFEEDARSLLWKPPPRPEYERLKCNDFIFVFKYDENKPDMLHIYSRHMTTPDDVINLFFSYDPIWDEERKRFGNYSDTHGLYWFWRNKEKKVVMVISCFRKQPERPAK